MDENIRKEMFPCNFCDVSSVDLTDYQKHQLAHENERPYKCSYNMRGFNQFSKLNNHQWTHTGERPYACKVCKRSFIKASKLEIHQRTHTGERPYACKVCQRSFSDLSNLKRHQRTHTGERPFLCKECKRSFANLSNLIGHRKRMHALKEMHSDIDKCELNVSCTIQRSSFSKQYAKDKDHSSNSRSDLTQQELPDTGESENLKYVSVKEDLFMCELCSYSSNEELCLNIHYLSHYSDDQ